MMMMMSPVLFPKKSTKKLNDAANHYQYHHNRLIHVQNWAKLFKMNRVLWNKDSIAASHWSGHQTMGRREEKNHQNVWIRWKLKTFHCNRKQKYSRVIFVCLFISNLKFSSRSWTFDTGCWMLKLHSPFIVSFIFVSSLHLKFRTRWLTHTECNEHRPLQKKSQLFYRVHEMHLEMFPTKMFHSDLWSKQVLELFLFFG